MEIAVSVELNETGGRLLFRNRQTRSLLFSYDIEHKAEATRIVSQLSVLIRHFETLAQRDTKTLDMFRLANRRPDPEPVQRPDPDDALWTHEWRSEEKKEIANE